jgi:hypothetical protein
VRSEADGIVAQGYDAAAEAARDAGVLEKQDMADWQAQRKLQSYLTADRESDDFDEEAYNKLIEETTEAAMNQEVRDAYGHNAGKRKNVTVWEDTHGNIMQHNTNTGNRSKLVDSGDR